MSTHTATPWRRASKEHGDEYSSRVIADYNASTSATVAKFGPHDPYIPWETAAANAAFAVLAVNFHAMLLNASETLLRTGAALDKFETASGRAWHKANDAHEQAKSELHQVIAFIKAANP